MVQDDGDGIRVFGLVMNEVDLETLDDCRVVVEAIQVSAKCIWSRGGT